MGKDYDLDIGFRYMPFWAQAVFMALFVVLFDSVFHLGIVLFFSQFLYMTGYVLFLVGVIFLSVAMEALKRIGVLSSTGTGLRTSYRLRR